MRRLAASAAIALFAAAPAGAHPGHGAESVNVDGDFFRYAPQTVTIGVGDTVFWFWKGDLARNHSVTADPNQAEQFDSDPNGPPTNDTHPVGDSFSHTFQHDGLFTYRCKVHATMQGTVEVVQLPGQGARLKLSGLKVSPRAQRIEVRFRLSTVADLSARIAQRRDGRWETLKTVYRKADIGKNRIELPRGGLEDGRYRLTLAAYDQANRRTEARETFSLG